MNTHGILKLAVAGLIFVGLAYDSVGSEPDLVLHGDRQTAAGLSAAEVRWYRYGMIRMNKEPINMSREAMISCIWHSDLHDWPGVVYYINETAAVGMSEFLSTRHFPVGSIIIKEKQDKKTEDSVKIITVMKKIKAGAGDDTWDYKMYDIATWQEVQPTQKVSVLEGGITKWRTVKTFAGTSYKMPYTERGVVKEHTVTCIECHTRYGLTDNISPRGMQILFKDDYRWARSSH